MSKDTIYREDAIKVASEECHEFRGIFGRIEERIKELPSADRLQGKWIEVEEDWRHQIEFWKCSECDFAVSSMYNYCPNCGARMKGADDEVN